MTKEQANFLSDAIECEGEDCHIIPDYSGRGMFGCTTYAISCDSFPILLNCVLAHVKTHPTIQIPDFDSFRTDNMGMGIVIY